MNTNGVNRSEKIFLSLMSAHGMLGSFIYTDLAHSLSEFFLPPNAPPQKNKKPKLH